MSNVFGDRKIYFEPGTKFSYSGQAFSYLQQVIESVTTSSYQAFMESAFLPDIGMRQSSFHFDIDGKPVVLAAASLVSTPSDLSKLFIELVKPRPENRNVAKLLTEPSVEVIKDLLNWGLGVGIYGCDGDEALWQWGSNNTPAGTYNSLAVIYRRRKTGIMLMTSGSKGQSLLKTAVKTAIGGPDFKYWEDIPAPIPPQ